MVIQLPRSELDVVSLKEIAAGQEFEINQNEQGTYKAAPRGLAALERLIEGFQRNVPNNVEVTSDIEKIQNEWKDWLKKWDVKINDFIQQLDTWLKDHAPVHDELEKVVQSINEQLSSSLETVNTPLHELVEFQRDMTASIDQVVAGNKDVIEKIKRHDAWVNSFNEKTQPLADVAMPALLHQVRTMFRSESASMAQTNDNVTTAREALGDLPEGEAKNMAENYINGLSGNPKLKALSELVGNVFKDPFTVFEHVYSKLGAQQHELLPVAREWRRDRIINAIVESKDSLPLAFLRDYDVPNLTKLLNHYVNSLADNQMKTLAPKGPIGIPIAAAQGTLKTFIRNYSETSYINELSEALNNAYKQYIQPDVFTEFLHGRRQAELERYKSLFEENKEKFPKAFNKNNRNFKDHLDNVAAKKVDLKRVDEDLRSALTDRNLSNDLRAFVSDYATQHLQRPPQKIEFLIDTLQLDDLHLLEHVAKSHQPSNLSTLQRAWREDAVVNAMIGNKNDLPVESLRTYSADSLMPLLKDYVASLSDEDLIQHVEKLPDPAELLAAAAEKLSEFSRSARGGKVNELIDPLDRAYDGYVERSTLLSFLESRSPEEIDKFHQTFTTHPDNFINQLEGEGSLIGFLDAQPNVIRAKVKEELTSLIQTQRKENDWHSIVEGYITTLQKPMARVRFLLDVRDLNNFQLLEHISHNVSANRQPAAEIVKAWREQRVQTQVDTVYGQLKEGVERMQGCSDDAAKSLLKMLITITPSDTLRQWGSFQNNQIVTAINTELSNYLALNRDGRLQKTAAAWGWPESVPCKKTSIGSYQAVAALIAVDQDSNADGHTTFIRAGTEKPQGSRRNEPEWVEIRNRDLPKGFQYEARRRYTLIPKKGLGVQGIKLEPVAIKVSTSRSRAGH
ncbi:MAG: hypothetical protein V4568_19075 [Pseudomonadota bacterium]